MAAYVLGNGVSRLEVNLDHLKQHGTIYGCNALYRSFTPAVLVATDTPIAKEIQELGYSKINTLYTRRPTKDSGALVVPKPYFGFSSGPIAVALAANDKHDPIYLVGFDMGPTETNKFNNVFAGTPHYKPMGSQPTFTGNWVKQITKVCQDHPNRQFYRVVGSTTARLPELENIPNLAHVSMTDFLAQVNRL